MFSDKGIRTADVIASTDVSVVIFTVEDYERLAKISPSIAQKYKLFFETMNITLKVLESLRNECGQLKLTLIQQVLTVVNLTYSYLK